MLHCDDMYSIVQVIHMKRKLFQISQRSEFSGTKGNMRFRMRFHSYNSLHFFNVIFNKTILKLSSIIYVWCSNNHVWLEPTRYFYIRKKMNIQGMMLIISVGSLFLFSLFFCIMYVYKLCTYIKYSPKCVWRILTNIK